MASAKTDKASPMTMNERKLIQEIAFNALYSRRAFMDRMLDQSCRDLNHECQYPDEIDRAAFRQMYDREGIASRVVKIYPEGCWTEDPEVYEDESPEVETEFEKGWLGLVQKHNLYHYLHRIDELSGIGAYGVMLMGFNDGADMSQPLPGVSPTGEMDTDGFAETTRERKLLYLMPFDQASVDITEYETNPANPRFAKPTMYSLKLAHPSALGGGQPSLTLESAAVHWSRVLHVADNCESSEVFGVPRMQNSYNRLLDLRKLLGGSAEMFWKGAFPGYSFEANPDLTDVEMDSASIRDELEKYMNRLQRFIAIQGVQAKSLSPQVADPSMHIEVQVRALCIALACPYRIFLGSEEAKLASTQDVKTWNKRLAHRQTKYLTPKLIRPFVNRLVVCGVLPPPLDLDDYQVEFPDLNALSDIERVEIAHKQTDAMAKYVQGGVETLAPPLEYLTEFLGIPKERAEMILEAALEHVSALMDETDETQPQGKTQEDPPPIDPFELEGAKANSTARVAVETEKAKVKSNPRPKPAAPKESAAKPRKK